MKKNETIKNKQNEKMAIFKNFKFYESQTKGYPRVS